jgi:hypothetical protein
MICEKRNPGKFTRAGCERLSAETESPPVTKTWGCLEGGNVSRRGEGGR